MVRPSIWTLAWAVASSAWAAVNDGNEAASNETGDAFIVECSSREDIEPLVGAIQQLDGQVSRRFESDIFYGVSARMATGGRARIQKIQGVKNTWPVEVSSLAEDEGMPETQPEAQPEAQPSRRRRLGRRGAGKGVDPRWHHAMMQVDRLHADGFLGSGIQIAIVDSGVNYTHPALGGCFGQGCRVVVGDNLMKNGRKGDPMDCLGHGTSVAGIVAGDDEEAGFVGVAPRATLAAYRVLDCDGVGSADDMVAGWLKAYEDGAHIIASSIGFPVSGWSSGPIATVVSRIAAKGVPCIIGFGNNREVGLFAGLDPSTGHGALAVNSFAAKSAAPAPQGYNGSTVVETAGMSEFSTVGPNWSLDIKPNVGAPGDDIPCPRVDGGYFTCSGTSFSGPQVAGIAALVAERRGTFDPVLLNSLLMATAELQRDDGHAIPVVHQGAGLVRAWDAAHATTVLEPASLAFNDTDHRVPSIGLRITNTAESEVVYQLSDVPARTLYALRRDAPRLFHWPEFVQAAATIRLSESSITLGPGQSATVDVSAQDPEGLDQDLLPVWSGWVAVNGSDGKSLTIPYLGLAGSLREHRVLEPVGAAIADKNPSNYVASAAYEKKDGALSLGVPLLLRLNLGSPLVRAEIVPVSPHKWLAERLGDRKSLAVHGFPKANYRRYEESLDPSGVKMSGQLESGDYLPVSKYKFVVRALRIFGDPNVESDWDTAETTTFDVTRGAGEEACKIYQAGNSDLPEGALFRSLEDCLQAHGKMLADAPWVPEPRDRSVGDKCSDEDPTEDACGTYRFCQAHGEDAGVVRSPFYLKWDCVQGHRFLPIKEQKIERFPECISTIDEDICGTRLWCQWRFDVKQSSAQPPTDEYANAEECQWAHGILQ